jgi:hypothetical protein
VSDFADSLLACPAIQFRGSAIPVGDDIVRVSDEDCVVREIEKMGLLAQCSLGPRPLDFLNSQRLVGLLERFKRFLEVIARVPDRFCRAPLRSAQRPDKKG